MRKIHLGWLVKAGALSVATCLTACGRNVELGDDGAAGHAGTAPAGSTSSGGGDTSGGGRDTSGGGRETSGGGRDTSGGGRDTSGGDGAGSNQAGAGSGGSNNPQVATCPATCADPAGTIQPLPTVEDFYAAFVGKWRICAGGLDAFGGEPEDVIGVEYAPPEPEYIANLGTILRGKMYYLVEGDAGPERGAGFAYQLTYDVSPQNPSEGPPVQLNMHPTPNSGFGGSFLYSPCPREWSLSGGSANPNGNAILVPIE